MAQPRYINRPGLNKPTTPRDCMTCGRPIESTGPGHRMCHDCRRGGRDYSGKDRSYDQSRWGPGVAERDNICRQVVGMAPRRES